MMILVPYGVDVPMWRRPWVNYAIIALIVYTSVKGFYDQDFFLELAGIELVAKDGLEMPEEVADALGDLAPELVEPRLTTKYYPLWVLAVTSTLLHGGWLHLIGNMWFLWVFGNAINYKFGHVGYIGLYVAAGMAGGLAHYGYSDMPAVGASGAINGVMAAFLIFFPRNNISMFFGAFWFLPPILIARRFAISSGWIIVFWAAFDALYLVLEVNTRTALWGHIGGFLAGLCIGLLAAVAGIIKPTQDEQTLLQVFTRR